MLATLNLWKNERVPAHAYQVVGQALYRLRFPANGVSLAALPWESLWDEEKNQAVLIRGNAIDSCERYVDIDESVPPTLTGNQKLHILALSPKNEILSHVRQAE